MASDVTLDLLSPSELELFTFHLVHSMRFEEVTQVSGPGDGGADVIAYLPSDLPGIRSRSRKWVFQCKQTKRLTKLDVEKELSNFAAGRIDTWVLVTNWNPTPGFRTWFDALRESDRYPFQLEAWWGRDLELYVQEYARDLVRLLPQNIRNAIGLTAPSSHQTQQFDLIEVCARFRDQVNFQVQQYAGAKYIPSLYVRREIQNEITSFTETESTIANGIYSQAETALLSLKTELQGYYEQFRITAERDPIRVTKQWLSQHNFDKKYFPLMRPHFLQLLYKTTAQWREDFYEDLCTTLDYLREIPRDKFRERQAEYRRIANRIDDLLQRSNKAQGFSVPTLPKRYANPIKLRPGEFFGILDLDSFNKRTEGLLVLAREAVYRALQHALLLIDRAGSGKTNFVCDLVTMLATDQPVVIIFGKQPYSDGRQLIESIQQVVRTSLGVKDASALTMIRLDEMLEAEDRFLVVVVDGINENRKIEAFDTALAELLEWSSQHRIHLILTCRDIYSEFFQALHASPFIHKHVKGQLRIFSEVEFHSAIPLYFQHFRIDCTLDGAAKEAYSHPLLLRFFCEAYGSTDGNVARLGAVRDIRLKELFKLYLDRKGENIRKRLSHYDSHFVINYLLRMAHDMFRRSVSNLYLEQVEDATSVPHSNAPDSLYLNILDEDIIIAEQPEHSELLRQRVGFVYEELMEYLVARSLLERDRLQRKPKDLFSLLDRKRSNWIQVRGVAEYIAFSLLEVENEAIMQNGYQFMRLLSYPEPFWYAPFWNVVARLAERQTEPVLLDMIQKNLQRGDHLELIVGCLTALDKRSPTAASKLAAIILWSVCLPRVVTWSDFAKLRSGGNPDESQRLSKQLVDNMRPLGVAVPEGHISYVTLLNGVFPFLSEDILVRLDPMMGTIWSRRGTALREYLILYLAEFFPEYYPMLLNGLTSQLLPIRSFCAKQLRYSSIVRPQLSMITSYLATREENVTLRTILSDTSAQLSLGAIER